MQRVEEMGRPLVGQMIDDGLGFPAPFDHTGLAQRAELLGKRRLANAELLLDLAHRVFALAKEASNQQPLRVAEELEDFRDPFGAAVQPGRLLLPPGLNHGRAPDGSTSLSDRLWAPRPCHCAPPTAAGRAPDNASTIVKGAARLPHLLHLRAAFARSRSTNF
jgi:hypothetical protein